MKCLGGVRGVTPQPGWSSGASDFGFRRTGLDVARGSLPAEVILASRGKSLRADHRMMSPPTTQAR